MSNEVLAKLAAGQSFQARAQLGLEPELALCRVSPAFRGICHHSECLAKWRPMQPQPAMTSSCASRMLIPNGPTTLLSEGLGGP